MFENIEIPAGEVRLEGLLEKGDPHRGGVVAHPHPLYGGSMHNNVVLAAMAGFKKAGFTGLCFNFRGVGGSTGSHDEGRGEQEDLAGAVGYLMDLGCRTVQAAGYSFGAWTAAFAWSRLRELGPLPPLILIAPPAAFMSFEGLDLETRIGLIICGERDEIAPPDMAEEFGRKLSRPVKPVVIPGTDHFFGGHEDRIADLTAEYLRSLEG